MVSYIVRSMLAALLVLMLVACNSSGGTRDTAAAGSSLPAPDTTSASGAYQGATDYRVGAQDLLAISVFGVQDLTKEVRVNSNGQISLPLIGAVMAGGRTIPELEAELARKYSEGYLQKPQVSVFVKEFISQRATLEGAVVKPGIYPITGKTTLLQAIAVAGECQIDLAAQEVRWPGGTGRFDIDPETKHRLLNGLDDIGITLSEEHLISDFESKRPSWKPVTL